MKNARNAQKKLTKNLEKERGKLTELQVAPEKHRSEITKMEAKLVTLEVCVSISSILLSVKCCMQSKGQRLCECFVVYSGTSDKGPSEIGTTSLQGTKLLVPKCPLFHCIVDQQRILFS